MSLTAHADVEASFYMQLGRSGEAFFLRDDAEGDAYADGALAGFSSEDDEVSPMEQWDLSGFGSFVLQAMSCPGPWT